MASLTSIEGIGPALADKLKSAGVGSTDKLLDEGATKSGRTRLAEASGIDAKRILRFVNHADLMRVKGIGGEYAELLEAAGVDTVPELARRNPDNLHAKLEATNEEKNLVRNLASATQVSGWVDQAKSMEKRVTH
jgi:predicted flap endonuclease-1-like 5' DNA nuclease